MRPEVEVHVPVRNPLATSISWRSYYPDREDFDEFRRWDLALDMLGNCPDVTFHKVEDLPVYEGQSGAHWAKSAYAERDLERLLTLPEVPVLLDWLKDWRDFFSQWYDEDELWYAR